MDPLTLKNYDIILAELNNLNKQAAIERLSEMDDTVIWNLYKEGCSDALVTLFKKYHRQIVVLVYRRLRSNENISLAMVQDAFSDFLEMILSGQFSAEEIEKNFTAFSVHHLSYLVRSRARLSVNCKVQELGIRQSNLKTVDPHLRVEEKMDMNKVIDLIPNITNRVYRMVLWLVFILGYNSQDLTQVFGQREKAYDKRSRAMKAFREMLKREGILEELR